MQSLELQVYVDTIARTLQWRQCTPPAVNRSAFPTFPISLSSAGHLPMGILQKRKARGKLARGFLKARINFRARRKRDRFAQRPTKGSFMLPFSLKLATERPVFVVIAS